MSPAEGTGEDSCAGARIGDFGLGEKHILRQAEHDRSGTA